MVSGVGFSEGGICWDGVLFVYRIEKRGWFEGFGTSEVEDREIFMLR